MRLSTPSPRPAIPFAPVVAAVSSASIPALTAVSTATLAAFFLWRRQQRQRIYLDHNGTTPVDARVAAVMRPYFFQHFGNPSSSHWAGEAPRGAVAASRKQILQLLGAAQTASVWFTGCGTEADNLAIRLALDQASSHSNIPHIVTCNVEHPAIENYLKSLQEGGSCTVTFVPVGTDGRVAAADIMAAVQPTTCLVTLMLANNETGALQPVRQVAEQCRRRGVLFHTDAAQAVGKVDVTVQRLGDPDMVSVVGHKMGAPKGVACLYVRDDKLFENVTQAGGVLLVGGGQEFGIRGGTENVPYIVGMGKAAEIALQEQPRNARRMEDMREQLLQGLLDGLGGTTNVRPNGPLSPQLRLPNTLSVGIKDLNSAVLLREVGDRLAATAGASCHSNANVSAVLTAMKVPIQFARGTLRLSVGPSTTRGQVQAAVRIIVDAARQQQKAS